MELIFLIALIYLVMTFGIIPVLLACLAIRLFFALFV